MRGLLIRDLRNRLNLATSSHKQRNFQQSVMMARFHRLAQTRCSIRLVLGASLLISLPSEAAEHYRSLSAGVACVDPLATLALDSRHARSPAWRHHIRRAGRCFTIRRGEQWDWIASSEPHLLLLRRRDPRAGQPPLYFNGSLMQAEFDARAARQAAPARRVATASEHRHPEHRIHQIDGRLHDAVRAWHAIPRIVAPARPGPLAAVQPPAIQPPAVPLPRATPVGPSPAPTATPAPGSVLPSLAPAFTPIMPTAALLRSERIGRVIGAFLFFGLLCSLLALFAFITWRLRARAQAAFAERMTDTELAPVPAGPGVRPMQYRGAPDEVAMASQAKLPDRPLQPARAAAAPGALADYKSRCVSMLRLAGWDARTRPPGGNREPDVIARRGARLLALQCHVSSEPVDVQAVEDACLAREKQRSDLAAIVSRSRYTEAARQLADRTGVVLLQDHELASFGA